MGHIVQATADLRNEIRRGRHVVQVLDTLVSGELDESPGLLRNWKTSRRAVAHSGGSGGGDGVLIVSPAA